MEDSITYNFYESCDISELQIRRKNRDNVELQIKGGIEDNAKIIFLISQ